ncbi:hypothetical protein OAM71_00885 [Pelagibacteraceae bacterium]|nr:hypothetical protein [Pelagibacteraceae bacterium]
MFFKKKIIDKCLIALFFIIFFSLIFKNYSGNYKSVEIFLWTKALGLTNFPLDFFVNRTFYDDLSIIYKLFAKLKLNLSNDNIGFSVYIFFTSISAFFTFKIIKEFFLIKDMNEILMILLVLSFFQTVILYANSSSWISSHTATATFFVMTLKSLFIWLLLTRKILFLAIISSLMLLIGIKSAWFIVGVSFLYSIINFKLLHNCWIIIPLITILYLKSISPEVDFNEHKFFFENIIYRDKLETAFHLQPIYNLILLIVSFPLFYYLINNINIKSEIKKLLNIVLIISILNFVFYYLLARFGMDIFPEPRLLVLSGTRAMELYENLFSITLLCYIMKSKLNYFYKILFLFFLMHLITRADIAVIGSILLIIALLFMYKIEFILKKEKYLEKKISILIFLISFLPTTVYLINSKIKNDFSLYSYKQINKWTMGELSNDKVRVQNLLYLRRNCDDFVFLDFKYPMEIANHTAYKSSFLGRIHFNYFDKELIIESKMRRKIFLEIKKSIELKKKINQEILDELFRYEVFLLLDDKQLMYFPKDLKKFNFKNGETLLIFSDTQDIKNLCSV